MPKTGAKPRSSQRRRKPQTVTVGMPALETRSRHILAEIIEEAMMEPDGLKLPDPAAFAASDVLAGALPEPAQPDTANGEVSQPVDDLATHDLVTVVQHGASLEVDGSRYTSDELALLAENVTDQAHLKINNSGSFSAKELAAIAQSGPGQVIFA